MEKLFPPFLKGDNRVLEAKKTILLSGFGM
jgi:hypothetical protein